MARESIALLELVEKYTKADLFREVGQWPLRRLMDLQTEAKIGAAPHQRRR